jgi:hypothetical protein
MDVPVMTAQLASRLQQALTSLTVAGLASTQQQPGNPFGIELRRFGSATAILAERAPADGWWNRVVGLLPADADLIDDIVAFYRQHGRRCHIDLNPLTLTEAVARRLVGHGFYPIPNGTVLYGMASSKAAEMQGSVEIREIGADEAAHFAELWADGFEVAGPERDIALQIRMGWFTLPENRRYVAYVDGAAAAMAALFIHDRIGHLNVGATLPAFRGRGIHRALTSRRVADAAKAGCELVIGDTGGFGTASQNNMERAGLRIAYTRVTMVNAVDDE